MLRLLTLVHSLVVTSVCSAVLVTEPSVVPTAEIDRFDNSSSFLTSIPNSSSFDFTGVGQLDSCNTGTGLCRWATMISPTHFVSATHSHPSASVRFRDDAGNVLATHSVSGGMAVGGSDLWLGELTTAVDTSIIHVYGLAAPTAGMHVGENVIQAGIGTAPHFRVGQNRLDKVFDDLDVGAVNVSDFAVFLDNSTAGVTSTTDPDDPFLEAAGSTLLTYETYFQGGDSGGPSFIDSGGGELQVIGIHSFIAEFSTDANAHTSERRGSADVYLPAYHAELNAKISAVPEPRSFLYLALSASLAIGMRQVKRRLLCR